MTRIDSLNSGYQTGDLSVFPEAIDNKESLYEVKNNAETKLTQSLGYSGSRLVVESTLSFPNKGILRIGSDGKQGELIYYGSKTNNTFKDLVRGFAGSRQNQWNVGAKVGNTVSAEHHNAVKDAIIKIEVDLGLVEDPNEISLNGILKKQENKFLTPKPIFRAFPIKGPPPLSVTFQNFSSGPLVKYFWDFGDGTTSTEKSPIHTYYQEGSYTVELTVISILGGQAITSKSNYVFVSNEEKQPFFYIKLFNDPGIGGEAANKISGNSLNKNNPSIFEFIDQTDGDIQERYWNFGSEGRVIKNLYNSTFYNIDNNQIKITIPGRDVENIFKAAALNSNYSIVFTVGKQCYLITKQDLISVNYADNAISCSLGGSKSPNGKTEIIIKNTKNLNNLSGSMGKVGAIIDGTLSNYTESDPNIHSIYFIYENKNTQPQPSVFVLYRNQTIKKSFLKQENGIQII